MKILDADHLNFSDISTIITAAHTESFSGIVAYDNTKLNKMCKCLEEINLMNRSRYYSGYSCFNLTTKGIEAFREIERKLKIE